MVLGWEVAGCKKMIRQNKNRFNRKVLVFVAVYAVLVVFSVAWYTALANMRCELNHSNASGHVSDGINGDSAHNCSEQLYFHWVKFLGIDGLLYGAPLTLIFVKTRKPTRP